MKIKQSKGITLIALVITIIILLILAGVTINMLTGDNGILKQATNARETNSKAEFEEEVKLAVIASRVNDTASINTSDLETELNKISGTTIIKSEEDKLPWTVKKENYEVTITLEGTLNETGTEDTRTVIEQAKAAMPEGASIDPTTNEDTGIVMIDSNKNEWVWIEVPSLVFSSAINSKDYDNIKADLITYAKEYRGYADEWYDGCGLTYDEYNTNYNKMLSSIYTNKGFYIGRYEAGIDGSDIDTNLARYKRTDITSNSPKAVSKKDMIPYNFVTCSDAQQLANRMSTGNKTSSLMFGIQWNLVCKFLETKGIQETYLMEDSTSWGNYSNSNITLSRGRYNINSSSSSSVWTPFNTDTKDYVTSCQTNNDTSYKQLFTTGASENANKMNIYDLAGNEMEFTLEKYTNIKSNPCVARGGFYYDSGAAYPVANHLYVPTINCGSFYGLRSSLY